MSCLTGPRCYIKYRYNLLWCWNIAFNLLKYSLLGTTHEHDISQIWCKRTQTVLRAIMCLQIKIRVWPISLSISPPAFSFTITARCWEIRSTVLIPVCPDHYSFSLRFSCILPIRIHSALPKRSFCGQGANCCVWAPNYIFQDLVTSVASCKAQFAWCMCTSRVGLHLNEEKQMSTAGVRTTRACHVWAR